MSPIGSRGGLLLVAVALTRVHADAQILGPQCGRIEVAYVQGGQLYYAQVRQSTHGNRFLVSWAELPSAGPEGTDRHSEVLAVEVPESVGQRLLDAFDRLAPSGKTGDYGFDSSPPLSAVHNYGVARCDAQSVIGCAISEWALAAQTKDSLKIAWWVQLLKSTLWRWKAHRTTKANAIVGSALRELLPQVSVDVEMPVCGGELAEWHGSRTINAGTLLRSAIARGLIYGDLVSEPRTVPEKELRLAAIERYSLDFQGDQLAKLLLPFLHDAEPDVRFAAAYDLAGIVDLKHVEIRRALDQYLRSETDASRRHWVESSMSEIDKAGKGVLPTPTP